MCRVVLQTGNGFTQAVHTRYERTSTRLRTHNSLLTDIDAPCQGNAAVVLPYGSIASIPSICYIPGILIHTTVHFRFKYDTPTTSLTHQQQEDLRILAENEPSLIVVRYCNIPADSVSVAEASTRLSMIATAKRTGRIESGGIVADCKPAFIISLRTVRIQESVACQATSLAR